MSTSIKPQPIEGIPISNILSAFPTTTGGGNPSVTDISTRLSTLSVPTGYTYIPENQPHKLQFQSDTSKFTYSTIPEELYDKLIGLVSVNSGLKKQHTTSRKSRSVPNKSTRRKSA
jgi:hypothetical protein